MTFTPGRRRHSLGTVVGSSPERRRCFISHQIHFPRHRIKAVLRFGSDSLSPIRGGRDPGRGKNGGAFAQSQISGADITPGTRRRRQEPPGPGGHCLQQTGGLGDGQLLRRAGIWLRDFGRRTPGGRFDERAAALPEAHRERRRSRKRARLQTCSTSSLVR